MRDATTLAILTVIAGTVVSIRSDVLHLMRRFRDELGISFVYVSHDLPTIRYVADRTAIMYLGEIVEMGPTEAVISKRKHPYTQLLLDASPEPDPEIVKPPLEAAGEIPSAIEPPNGCRFHTRCPLATPACGWEGRDVKAALEQRAIDGDISTHLGKAGVEGLGIAIEATGDIEAAARELDAIMRWRNPSLAQAATVSRSERRLHIAFDAKSAPKMREVGDGHRVACVLYKPV